jgi:hypothetical protein
MTAFNLTGLQLLIMLGIRIRPGISWPGARALLLADIVLQALGATSLLISPAVAGDLWPLPRVRKMGGAAMAIVISAIGNEADGLEKVRQWTSE